MTYSTAYRFKDGTVRHYSARSRWFLSVAAHKAWDAIQAECDSRREPFRLASLLPAKMAVVPAKVAASDKLSDPDGSLCTAKQEPADSGRETPRS